MLGVDINASIETIKSAYKEMARKYHPDQMIAAGMPEEFIAAATDRLASINAAYDALTKLNLRRLDSPANAKG